MDLIFDWHLARPLIVSVEIFWKILDRRCDEASAFAFCSLDDGSKFLYDERHSSGRGRSFEVTSAVARRGTFQNGRAAYIIPHGSGRLSNLDVNLRPHLLPASSQKVIQTLIHTLKPVVGARDILHKQGEVCQNTLCRHRSGLYQSRIKIV